MMDAKTSGKLLSVSAVTHGTRASPYSRVVSGPGRVAQIFEKISKCSVSRPHGCEAVLTKHIRPVWLSYAIRRCHKTEKTTHNGGMSSVTKCSV